MVSRYNDERPEPGPRNMQLIVTKRLLLQGFIINDHSDRAPDFFRDMAGWLRDGKVQYRETYVERDRERAAGVHRPSGRREHREDARSP